jgi:hypothetical protein
MVPQNLRVFIGMQLTYIALSIIWNVAGIALVSQGLRRVTIDKWTPTREIQLR